MVKVRSTSSTICLVVISIFNRCYKIFKLVLLLLLANISFCVWVWVFLWLWKNWIRPCYWQKLDQFWHVVIPMFDQKRVALSCAKLFIYSQWCNAKMLFLRLSLLQFGFINYRNDQWQEVILCLSISSRVYESGVSSL